MSTYGGWPGQPGQPGPPPGWTYVPQAPKPGVIHLQPLRISDIISGIFSTVRHFFWALYGPLLIALAGTAALWGIAGAVCYQPLHTLYDNVQQQDRMTGSQAAEFAGYALIVLLLFLVSWLVWFTVSGLTSAAVLRHAVVGRPAKTRQIVSEATPHLWRALGALGLMTLVGGAALTVSALLLLLPGGAAGLGALCLIATYILAFYAGVRLLLLLPVIVLENQRPVAALRRAWALNTGNWWRTLGISLVVSLMASVASQIITTPVSSLLTDGTGSRFTVTPGQSIDWSSLPAFGTVWMYCVGLILATLIAGAITLPLSSLTYGLLYVDRRIRRESLDVQLAEEAGVPLAPQPPQPLYQPPYGQYPPPPYPAANGNTGWVGQQSPYGSWPGQQPPPQQPGWQPAPPPPAPTPSDTPPQTPPASPVPPPSDTPPA